MNWIITIPKKISWVEYMREVNGALTKDASLFFRVGIKVGIKRGDKLYRAHDGKVRGWIEVMGMHHQDNGFECRHTGKRWPAGWYVECKGKFNEVDGPAMKGFRGIRRYTE